MKKIANNRKSVSHKFMALMSKSSVLLEPRFAKHPASKGPEKRAHERAA